MPGKSQGPASRGSRKWLQALVNRCPELIEQELAGRLGLGPAERVHWLSPLEQDNYKEYRDQAFLDRLAIRPDAPPLASFWPRLGPVWDGLARTDRGDLLLVETKAHIAGLIGNPIRAGGRSFAQIYESLEATKRFCRAPAAAEWTGVFYPYANRLAHLYWLRERKRLPAYLLLVCFLNDAEMNGPASQAAWEGALRLMEALLGVERSPLSEFILRVYIDVNRLQPSLE